MEPARIMTYVIPTHLYREVSEIVSLVGVTAV